MTSRIALVTGGTGTAICRRLLAQDHRVATSYRNEEKARARKQAMRAAGHDMALIPADVSDPVQAQVLIPGIEDSLGPLAILINNAGITRDTPFLKMDVRPWREVIDTNLGSLFNVTRPVIEDLRPRRWGRSVQIGSIDGQKGQYGQANYAAAKAGMHGFTLALAQENARHGITVNSVSPGYTVTAMVMAARGRVREDRRADPARPLRHPGGDRPTR